MKKLHKHLLNIREFVRFCIVGTISALIDGLFFYALLQLTSYQISLVVGYLVGLIFNYSLTIYWTFKQKPNRNNVLGVITAHLLNLFVVRMGLMLFFTKIILLSEEYAYIPTIFISVIVNFVMVKLVVTYSSKQI